MCALVCNTLFILHSLKKKRGFDVKEFCHPPSTADVLNQKIKKCACALTWKMSMGSSSIVMQMLPFKGEEMGVETLSFDLVNLLIFFQIEVRDRLEPRYGVQRLHWGTLLLGSLFFSSSRYFMCGCFSSLSLCCSCAFSCSRSPFSPSLCSVLPLVLSLLQTFLLDSVLGSLLTRVTPYAV